MSGIEPTRAPGVVTRQQWGALAPSGKLAQQAPPREAFLHYSDSPDADALSTWQQRATAVRQIQRFHMVGRGWSDIAYHYVVFQPSAGPIAGPEPSGDRGEPIRRLGTHALAGSVFAGRSAAAVPAAQLNHNVGTLAICVYADGKDAVLRRTLYIIEQLIRRHPSLVTLGWHGQVTATDCPGPHLRAVVPRIARATGLSVYR